MRTFLAAALAALLALSLAACGAAPHVSSGKKMSSSVFSCAFRMPW